MCRMVQHWNRLAHVCWQSGPGFRNTSLASRPQLSMRVIQSNQYKYLWFSFGRLNIEIYTMTGISAESGAVDRSAVTDTAGIEVAASEKSLEPCSRLQRAKQLWQQYKLVKSLVIQIVASTQCDKCSLRPWLLYSRKSNEISIVQLSSDTVSNTINRTVTTIS